MANNDHTPTGGEAGAKAGTPADMATYGHEDERVGYGRPPKSGQFKPGQSGNPKGRPKGARSLEGHFDTLLDGHITINDGQGKRSVSRREAMAMRVVENAMKGDPKSIQLLLQRDSMRFGAGTQTENGDVLSAQELALLNTYFEQGDGMAGADANAALSGAQRADPNADPSIDPNVDQNASPDAPASRGPQSQKSGSDGGPSPDPTQPTQGGAP